MAKYSIEDTTLTGIADAIREKTSSADPVAVTEMCSIIRGITTGAELTIVVSVDSGATVTATKGDLSVSAVSVGGTAMLKVPEGGIWTVLATMDGETSAEMAVEVATNYSTELQFTQIYGVEWDGTANTAWSRTDAAAGFTDPVPYVAGATTYGSPFDNIMPWRGMEIVEDTEAGTLVKIPKFWYKWTYNGTAMKLQIANGYVDGFFVSPAHADRGDGVGERDFVYVGRYHCGSSYKSVTGQTPKVSITRPAARTAIAALGDTVWQYDFAMYWTIMMLYLVEFANWNSQAKIGYGGGNGSSLQSVGTSDAMPYHTGTMQTSRTTYGAGVQYRHIEGLWDSCFDWCDGVFFGGNDVYCAKNPTDFGDDVDSNGTKVNTRSAASQYIGSWNKPTTAGFEYALCSGDTGGGENTYICDYYGYDPFGKVLFVGGAYNSNNQGSGAFYTGTTANAGSSFAFVGCRLMKLP